MIRVEKNTGYNAWVVRNSAAIKGYGPLMYDIAFSFAGKEGLTPDRDSIRRSAKNIWFYIWQNRKSEFDITSLKDPYGRIDSRYEYDKEDYLDKRYVMISPDTKKFSTLFQNNRKCLRMLNSFGASTEPEELLTELARMFFQDQYKA